MQRDKRSLIQGPSFDDVICAKLSSCVHVTEYMCLHKKSKELSSSLLIMDPPCSSDVVPQDPIKFFVYLSVCLSVSSYL